MPAGSRASLGGYESLKDALTDEGRNRQVASLQEVADKLECSLAQLAIAWCASNPNVSSVITGASRPEQVVDNLGAVAVIDKLGRDVLEEIDSRMAR